MFQKKTFNSIVYKQNNVNKNLNFSKTLSFLTTFQYILKDRNRNLTGPIKLFFNHFISRYGYDFFSQKNSHKDNYCFEHFKS